MKALLFVVFLGSTVTTILAESHSMSCSMVNGEWSCREMKDSEGNSAFSSSVAFGGPDGGSTYEGVGTGSNNGFNWDQGGTGVFSGANSPGNSGFFPGVNPHGGRGIFSNPYPYGGGVTIFPTTNPSGDADTYSGVNPDGSGSFPFINPSGGAGIFFGLNPSDLAVTFSGLNPSGRTSETEDPSPSGEEDDSTGYPEVTERTTYSPSTEGFNFGPLPRGIPGTFAVSGSRAFPGSMYPFVGTAAVAGFPFGGPRAFAGARAGTPFIGPVIIPGFPFRYPFGGVRAEAYAG